MSGKPLQGAVVVAPLRIGVPARLLPLFGLNGALPDRAGGTELASWPISGTRGAHMSQTHGKPRWPRVEGIIQMIAKFIDVVEPNCTSSWRDRDLWLVSQQIFVERYSERARRAWLSGSKES